MNWRAAGRGFVQGMYLLLRAESESNWAVLSLADKVAATVRPHAGGMDRAGGDVTAFAGAERARLPAHGQSHLALQNDVCGLSGVGVVRIGGRRVILPRSEEHTSELQSRLHLVCRLLLEKKNTWSRPT